MLTLPVKESVELQGLAGIARGDLLRYHLNSIDRESVSGRKSAVHKNG